MWCINSPVWHFKIRHINSIWIYRSSSGDHCGEICINMRRSAARGHHAAGRYIQRGSLSRHCLRHDSTAAALVYSRWYTRPAAWYAWTSICQERIGGKQDGSANRTESTKTSHCLKIERPPHARVLNECRNSRCQYCRADGGSALDWLRRTCRRISDEKRCCMVPQSIDILGDALSSNWKLDRPPASLLQHM